MWHFMALIYYLYFGEGFVPPFLYVGLVLVRRKCQFSCSCKQCIHILSGILKNDLVINLCNNGLSTLYYSSCSCRRINRWGRGWTSYSTPWSSCWISFSIKCRILYNKGHSVATTSKNDFIDRQLSSSIVSLPEDALWKSFKTW